MLLDRRDFLVFFVAACMAFVPVVFFGGFYISVMPISAMILHIGNGMNLILMAIYLPIYTAVFLGVGAAGYAMIGRLPWNLAREFALVGLLILPLLSSFARVITYVGWDGRGGTYTFWEAGDRYFEKRN